MSLDYKKLHSYLFYILLFLLPCNLAKHWPQKWSNVHGVLVDYLIPTLYLTDIIIIFLLVLWGVEKLKKNQKSCLSGRQAKIKNLAFYSLLFTLYFLLSLLSKNPYVSIYKLFKLAEMGLFSLWIFHHIQTSTPVLKFEKIVKVLSFSVIWQSILAIIQWFKQSSILGFWFFGEQPYNSTTLGIKTINFFGQLKIPPYGTFPHPNILAGFLTICLGLILFYFTHDPRSYKTKFRLVFLTAIILGLITLFLTFSLPAWTVLLFYILPIWLTNKHLIFYKYKLKKILLFTLYSLLFTLILLAGFKFVDPTSFSRRIKLIDITLKMWSSSPLFGVGLGNFIVRMEEFGTVVTNYRFLQPVHNVYLLILAETGIIGLMLVFWGLYLVFRKRKHLPSSLLFTLYSLIFLSLFDHYFFTIQQGMLLASLVLGLTSSSASTSSTTASASGKTTGRTNT